MKARISSLILSLGLLACIGIPAYAQRTVCIGIDAARGRTPDTGVTSAVRADVDATAGEPAHTSIVFSGDTTKHYSYKIPFLPGADWMPSTGVTFIYSGVMQENTPNLSIGAQLKIACTAVTQGSPVLTTTGREGSYVASSYLETAASAQKKYVTSTTVSIYDKAAGTPCADLGVACRSAEALCDIYRDTSWGSNDANANFVLHGLALCYTSQ